MAKDSIKIRMPALGGQGAVTAAHIAATAADTVGTMPFQILSLELKKAWHLLNRIQE